MTKPRTNQVQRHHGVVLSLRMPWQTESKSEGDNHIAAQHRGSRIKYPLCANLQDHAERRDSRKKPVKFISSRDRE
jgi:hypothetical protein